MNCPLCDKEKSRTLFERVDKHLGTRTYLKCSNCHLAFLHESQRLSREAEKKRYALHENSPDDKGYVQFLSQLADPLSKTITAGASGIDFGCGEGPTMSVILREKGFQVANYDPIFFPDRQLLTKQYDFVTATETLEHFYNPREEFDVLDHLMKPEKSVLGVMTKTIPREQSFGDWWYHTEPSHVCFYDEKTFEWIADWRQWTLEIPQPNVAIFSKRGCNRDSAH